MKRLLSLPLLLLLLATSALAQKAPSQKFIDRAAAAEGVYAAEFSSGLLKLMLHDLPAGNEGVVEAIELVQVLTLQNEQAGNSKAFKRFKKKLRTRGYYNTLSKQTAEGATEVWVAGDGGTAVYIALWMQNAETESLLLINGSGIDLEKLTALAPYFTLPELQSLSSLASLY
jgi:hypothetical protein